MATPTGIIKAVVATLSSGPMTAKQIAQVLSVDVRIVSNAIQSASKSTKYKIYKQRYSPDKRTYIKIYSLTPFENADEPHVHRSRNLPQRYLAPFRGLTPKEHDLWAHRNLAMLVR